MIGLLSLSIVSALEECEAVITDEKVPCAILLPVNVSITSCDTINVTFYSNNTFLASEFMLEVNDFTCSGNFTQTAIGTYTFFYSTGDSGSIKVTEGIIVQLLLFFSTAIAFLMLGFALWKQDTNFAFFSAFLFMIIGIFVFISGFGSLNNLITQGAASIMMGMGAYIAFRASVDHLNEAQTG